MGLLGSAFGRALAGAGDAAARISNKWIDEELAQQRAQALAELQRTTAKGIREDDDAFRNDPTRVARDRATRRDDALANAATAADAAIATNENTRLADSARTVKDRQAAEDLARRQTNAPGENKLSADAATAKAESDRATAKANAADPEFLASVGKLKLADPEVAARIAQSRASTAASYASAAQSGAQTEAVRLGIQDKKKLDALYDQAGSILSDPDLSDQQRASSMAKVEKQITLIKSKTGQVAARDPELDTQTVVDKKYDAAGNEIGSVTRKEVRKPGNAAAKEEVADPIKSAMDAAREARAAKDKAGKAAKPATAATTDAPQIETTTSRDGDTLYRYKGQTQWRKSRAEALNDLGGRAASASAPLGFDRGD